MLLASRDGARAAADVDARHPRVRMLAGRDAGVAGSGLLLVDRAQERLADLEQRLDGSAI